MRRQSRAQEFASSRAAFLETFSSAWVKMMNADRFKGPFENLCHKN
jgi:hypothetical protein